MCILLRLKPISFLKSNYIFQISVEKKNKKIYVFVELIFFAHIIKLVLVILFAKSEVEKHLMKKIDEKVKNRLYKYLSKDKVGIRKYLLNFFLQMKSCTTVEIYDLLITQGFHINYRAVSAMVGHMHSRLGILSFSWTNDHNVYTLKEDYLDIVRFVMAPPISR